MHSTPSRRAILTAGSIALAAGATGTVASPATQPADGNDAIGAFPAQPLALVREIVGASHRDIDKVRQLLDDMPQLANASWDWGFGDWETPLGAAAHVGRREIAMLLLERGARPDVFAFAMLGYLDAVKAMLSARPGLQRLRGPHGLSLLHHARAGGDEAKSVLDYLTSLGDADPTYTDLPLTADQRQPYVGEYSFGTGEKDRVRVLIPERIHQLAIQRIDRNRLGLFHQGNHTFLPAGGNDVRVVFEVTGDRATAIKILSPKLTMTAQRV